MKRKVVKTQTAAYRKIHGESKGGKTQYDQDSLRTAGENLLHFET